MKDTLTIALSKGKLLEPAIDLFKRVGLAPKDISPESRRLIFEHPASGTTLMIVRPSDVPTYVEYGVVDAGVVGADILMEQATDVFEPLDLGFGSCRLAVAALQPERGSAKTSPLRKPQALAGDVPSGSHAQRLRGAAKYPNMTERHLPRKGIPTELIKLLGIRG